MNFVLMNEIAEKREGKRPRERVFYHIRIGWAGKKASDSIRCNPIVKSWLLLNARVAR